MKIRGVDKMKKNRKGFTLIELLIVMAIMALLMILVFPSVMKVLKNNETKEYTYYEKTLLEAAKLYYDQNNSFSWTGCMEITYDQLIRSGLLKTFHDEAINCNYNFKSKVRIQKEADQEKFSVYLSCQDTKANKMVYETANIPTDQCETMSTSETKLVYDLLFDPNNLGETECTITNNSANLEFLSGRCSKNYIKYGDYVFRIYGRDVDLKTVSLILEDNIGRRYFGGMVWGESQIRSQLQEFYYYLPESRERLIEPTCLYYDDRFCEQFGMDSVGIMIADEETSPDHRYSPFLLTGGPISYLTEGKEPFWMLKSRMDLYPYDYMDQITDPSYLMLPVRPTLVLKKDVQIVGGTGTVDHPYLLER